MVWRDGPEDPHACAGDIAAAVFLSKVNNPIHRTSALALRAILLLVLVVAVVLVALPVLLNAAAVAVGLRLRAALVALLASVEVGPLSATPPRPPPGPIIIIILLLLLLGFRGGGLRMEA